MEAAALNDLRKRVLNNDPVTKEELALAVRTLVGERALAAAPKAPKGKKSATPVISLDDLTGE